MQETIPLVSIGCITYNHEKYIADAIEGFLMQKTNFKFEIIIRDDCSTDSTAEIIKEYAKKFPDLIKPIYETENQYSKGIRPWGPVFEKAKGKYIAICEGDDYWTDPYKLQKQVDYMEQHPECSLCTHANYIVDSNKTLLNARLQPNIESSKIIKIEEIREILQFTEKWGFFRANSMIFPVIFCKNLPDFYKKAPIGDFPLFIYLSTLGTVYYSEEYMSAYRVGLSDSWTSKNILLSHDKLNIYIGKLIEMLNAINIYTEYKYDVDIKRGIKKNKLRLINSNVNFKKAKKEELIEFYDCLNTNEKLKLFIKRHFPYIAKIIIKVKIKFSKYLNKIKLFFFNKKIGKNTFIDKTVHITGSRYIKIGSNCVIGEYSRFNINNRINNFNHIAIGNNCYIGKRTLISPAYQIVIKDYCLIVDDCKLLGANHIYQDPLKPYAFTGTNKYGRIVIGVNVWLGANVIVVGNIVIGHGSVIGAGSVVTKNIPPFSVAVGNPCRIIKRYNFDKRQWINATEWKNDLETKMPSEQEYIEQMKNYNLNVDVLKHAASHIFGDLI